ncbi:MAG: VOC family protein [Nitrosomonas sp.]|nr:VOC family protein [Nitrosomonas sp.]MCW5607081.1 VOC family protein [Nitrosomonas sp.]
MESKIVPHLWFDKEAREAAEFYTSIFDDSKIKSIVTLEGTPSGSVEVVIFELFGQEFQAISAGPFFKFNESISFMVKCNTQDEIDDYWEKLTADGGQEVECGWLKDKFGLSWQIVPEIMNKMMQSKNPEVLSRVTQAFLKMKKIDIAELQKAYEGNQGRFNMLCAEYRRLSMTGNRIKTIACRITNVARAVVRFFYADAVAYISARHSASARHR